MPTNDEREKWYEGAVRKAGIPNRFARSNMNQFSPGVLSGVYKFMALEDKGLFIHGPAGTGKTHLAAAIANKILRGSADCVEYPEKMQDVAFTTVPGLLVDIRSTFNRDARDTEAGIVEWYAEKDLLILDDLGAEKTTDWSMSTLYVIIDRRYAGLMQTIITSNLSVAEIAGKVGDRIASRIAGMCRVLELKGKDRRIAK